MNSKNLNNGTEVSQDTASLNTQSSVENHHNSKSGEELIKFHKIETIPFMQIVEDNQRPIKEWYGVIGTSKVTESYPTKDHVIESVNSTGVKNYPQLVAIVSGYLELITETVFKQLQEERGNK